jgi:hypothetical protein
MNPLEARKLLFKTYQQTKSIRKTAKIWKTKKKRGSQVGQTLPG